MITGDKTHVTSNRHPVPTWVLEALGADRATWDPFMDRDPNTGADYWTFMAPEEELAVMEVAPNTFVIASPEHANVMAEVRNGEQLRASLEDVR